MDKAQAQDELVEIQRRISSALDERDYLKAFRLYPKYMFLRSCAEKGGTAAKFADGAMRSMRLAVGIQAAFDSGRDIYGTNGSEDRNTINDFRDIQKAQKKMDDAEKGDAQWQ